MRDRASQQAALAGLGRDRRCRERISTTLLGDAAAWPRASSEADHVAVLERTRDGKGMLARAGVGLPDGVLGGVLPGGARPAGRDLGAASSIAADDRAAASA